MVMAADYWHEALELALDGAAGGDVGPLIASRYPGRCVTCTRRWEPGDLIGYDQDEDAWICADCAA
jgi:hypothetical protein